MLIHLQKFFQKYIQRKFSSTPFLPQFPYQHFFKKLKSVYKRDVPNIWGHSKGTFVEEGRGELLKSEQKQTGGGVLACVYVRFFK